jgi:hypothetical protein
VWPCPQNDVGSSAPVIPVSRIVTGAWINSRLSIPGNDVDDVGGGPNSTKCAVIGWE